MKATQAYQERITELLRAEFSEHFKRLEAKQDKHNSVIERQFRTEGQIKVLQEKIDVANHRLADLEHILGEKQSELNEIVSETRQEEETLRAKAKELETKVDERTLTAFKRIRKNARNGLGIVYVQRNACGGCFNRIPPQRQMEIRMHKKIIVCEYCGRIMIDPELAGVTPEA